MQTDPTPNVAGSNETLATMLKSTAGFQQAIEEMLAGTDQLNRQFGQTRQRATEMMKSVSDSIQRVVLLGGKASDAFNTLNKISEATGRNVIASADVAAKLYASSKVTGQNVETIVNSFLDIGYRFEDIGEQLEKATGYVRNMGLNTSQIMSKVVANFDQLNRFNFEGGVQGLTRMAAKATMFRIDMKEAFAFAEKVITPEGAIEVSNAFQRLGVAAGGMANPFALMNASLNDPGALQDTLVNITQKFTYFDREAKQFRINPEGVLKLRELATETNTSYKELAKAGLAASELGARLSQISPSIKFENEEDKQFLSNISTYKDGKYEVTLEDGTKKELSELTQPEFDKLIDKQKKLNQPMEEVAVKQLSLQEDIARNVKSILEAIPRGVASSKVTRGGLESARDLLDSTIGKVAEDIVKQNIAGKRLDKVMDGLEDLIKRGASGEQINAYQIKEKLGGELDKGIDDVKNLLTKVYEESKLKLASTGRQRTAEEAAELANNMKGILFTLATGISKKGQEAKEALTNVTGGFFNNIQGLLGGVTTPPISGNRSQTSSTGTGNQPLTQVINQTLTLGGTINVKVESTANVSTQQLQEYVNSDEVKRKFWEYTQKKLVDKGIIPNVIPPTP